MNKMPTLTTSKTTPGRSANGRYQTRIERSLAILRDKGADLPLSEFRKEFRARYHEILSPRDTTFYRARKRIKAEQLRDETEAIKTHEESPPNIVGRTIPSTILTPL